MKTILAKSRRILLLAGIAFAIGCSPDGHSNADSHTAHRLEGHVANLVSGLDRSLKDLIGSFEAGDGRPISKGEQILEEIVDIRDPATRTNCLEHFRRTMLGIQFDGANYIKLSNGISSMERLHLYYLSALFRSGGNLEQDIAFRLDFLKWLMREMERPHVPDSGRRHPGIHVSMETYIKCLRNTYSLHLRLLEEAFNDHVLTELSKETANCIRRQIEGFIGRRIRTNEEILRARRAKPNPPARSNGDVDVQIDI